jgi:hypothetical protein
MGAIPNIQSNLSTAKFRQYVLQSLQGGVEITNDSGNAVPIKNTPTSSAGNFVYGSATTGSGNAVALTANPNRKYFRISTTAGTANFIYVTFDGSAATATNFCVSLGGVNNSAEFSQAFVPNGDIKILGSSTTAYSIIWI